VRQARAAGRLSVLAAWTLGCYVAFLATRPAALFSSRTALVLQSACFRSWAKGVVRILGLRVTAAGSPPEPPFFLVTNHLGYLDVVVLAALAPCFFLAKSEVAAWPVLGFLARSMSTVFVDRARPADLPRVLERMERVARSGHGLAFFPEATSSPGEEVLPFRSSLFEAPARSGYPVCCARLRYETPAGEPPARLAVCWWGDMTFCGHFYELLKIPRLDASVVFGDVVTGHDRKELARAARAGVSRLLRAELAPGAAG
jgi:1-acyl-sn-glycerol-3-phosphate acyltransferase